MVEEVGGSIGRGAAFNRDWTKGNIFRNLWNLAWPMIITESFWAVGMTVYMIWVGKLGSASVAGVGVAGIIVILAIPCHQCFLVC